MTCRGKFGIPAKLSGLIPLTLIVFLLLIQHANASWLMLTRLDGHKVWINSAQVNTVTGWRPTNHLGYKGGTQVSVGSQSVIVQENVNEVVRALRTR